MGVKTRFFGFGLYLTTLAGDGRRSPRARAIPRIAPLTPDPPLQILVLLVDSLPVHAVTGPLKDSGELVSELRKSERYVVSWGGVKIL